MPNFQPITQERHGNQRWKRRTNYAFAARDILVPLVAMELPRAAMSLPIVLTRQGDDFLPAALLGLQPGKNLFLTADGQWLGAYVPAQLRGYPFVLANTQSADKVLCFDEESGLLTDDPSGEAFFDVAGEVAPAIQDVLNFLGQLAQNREATLLTTSHLHTHQLIKPWPITVRGPQGDQTLEGLYQIDEAALNQVPAEALQAIRDAGGLAMAYCQLLSMQHLDTLGQLARAHAQAEAQVAQSRPPQTVGDLDLGFLNGDSGTISFGNLG